MRNGWTILWVIGGTFIGAGFASGQEVAYYFAGYGRQGFWGAVCCGLFFGALVYGVLRQVWRGGVDHYRGYLEQATGKRLAALFEGVVGGFALCGFSVMLAGTGALLRDAFQWRPEMGAFLMSAVCGLILWHGQHGMLRVNNLLVPFLIVGMLWLGCRATGNGSGVGDWISPGMSWQSSALLYVGYNSITVIAILATMRPYLNQRTPWMVGLGSGAGLAGLLLFLIRTLQRCGMEGELPFFYLAQQQEMGGFYFWLLLAAMLTTAIGNGFAAMEAVERRVRMPRWVLCFLLCAGGYGISLCGFGVLVTRVYAWFGYLGLWMGCLFLLHAFLPKESKKMKKW